MSMKLSKVKLAALSMSVAALGIVGVLARNASADSCPKEYCSYPAQFGCAAPGTCMDRPWGSIRCLSGPNGGYWEGFMNQYCAH
jgi:hypothetical protein